MQNFLMIIYINFLKKYRVYKNPSIEISLLSLAIYINNINYKDTFINFVINRLPQNYIPTSFGTSKSRGTYNNTNDINSVVNRFIDRIIEQSELIKEINHGQTLKSKKKTKILIKKNIILFLIDILKIEYNKLSSAFLRKFEEGRRRPNAKKINYKSNNNSDETFVLKYIENLIEILDNIFKNL